MRHRCLSCVSQTYAVKARQAASACTVLLRADRAACTCRRTMNGLKRRSASDSFQENFLGDDLVDLNVAPQEPYDLVVDAYSNVRDISALADTLARTLGFGLEWILKLVRLILYSWVLWMGFLQMVLFYAFSNRIKRNIWYGRNPRNLLDLYIPYRRWLKHGKVPVVVFVTGGAWMIGYKGWGAILGRRLSQRGVMVACLDYRNFPQGAVPDMVHDVSTGIGWVLKNIGAFGGDRKRVFVLGQSCGGHLAALALLERAACMHDDDSQTIDAITASVLSSGFLPQVPPACVQPTWHPNRVRGFIGLSCPYDIEHLQQHFLSRGMNKRLLHAIFTPEATGIKGELNWRRCSPLQRVVELADDCMPSFPRTLLLHGDNDATVSHEESAKLAHALQKRGTEVELKIYRGATHTSPLIEGPMAGGRDDLINDILRMVDSRQDSAAFVAWPMLLFPQLTKRVASYICPF